MPFGMVVSIGSRRLQSRTTTKVSPGAISRSKRANTGRIRSAPCACSSRIVAQPAARNSSLTGGGEGG